LPIGIPFSWPGFASLSRKGWVAFYDSFKEPKHILVFDAPFENYEKDGVIYAVKEFLDIAFQDKTRPRPVLERFWIW
jgi:hypothetical protein